MDNSIKTNNGAQYLAQQPASAGAAAPIASPQSSAGEPSDKRASAKKALPKKLKFASFMSQWFNQYYRWVTIAVCVALLIAGYMLTLSSKLAAARSISGAQFDAVYSERQKLEQSLAYVSKLGSGQTAQGSRTVEEVDNLLPVDPATPQIFTSLENIAAKAGVVIDGIDLVISDDSTGKDSKVDVSLPSGVSFVEVSLVVSASPYGKLKALLSNIEANARLMDVISVTYSPTGKSYTITLRAYYLPHN